MKLKKALKITRNILLGILIIIFVFLLAVFIIDRISQKKELKMLDENGYVNKVSVGDYSLNVFIYGSETPKHTIVGMSGMGMDDYACTGRYVTDGLADENKIVFVDRAGYGMSDDTSKPQTLEQIIEDYRTALKNAGIESPYILMPHSIAGPYAAYWASEYPDEIEGVFFLDGTQINGEDFESMGDVGDVGAFDKLSVYASAIGLGRIYIPLFEKDLLKYPKENDVAVSLAMFYCNGVYGNAKYSEDDLQIENMKDAWYKTKANDIPKMYICASYGMETIEELEEVRNHSIQMHGKKSGWKDFPIDEKVLKSMKDFRHSNVDVFCEHVGNCELKLVPGDHLIYCHKPEKVQEYFEEFLDGLDADATNP